MGTPPTRNMNSDFKQRLWPRGPLTPLGVCVRMYLQDHSQGCMSRQSEGQGRGLREEVWMQSVVVGKVLRLGGRECPLGSWRQVCIEAGMHE